MTQAPFLILKAGAGSGKTFNLAMHYLMMALQTDKKTMTGTPHDKEELRDAFRHILAITFTNKAAWEMRSRIMDTLRAMGEGQQNNIADAIAKETGLPLKDLQARARTVYKAVLHHYSDLSVCTIDSFMVRVVRTFAHDLRLNSNFTIELDNDWLSSYIVDTLLSLVGNHNGITSIVCAYAIDKMNDAKSTNIRSSLTEAAKPLFQENARQYIDLLAKHDAQAFLNDRERLQATRRRYEERLQELAHNAIASAQDQGLCQDDFPGKSRGIYGFAVQMAKDGLPVVNETLLKIVTQDTIIPANAKEAMRAAIAPVDSAFMRMLHHEMDGMKEYEACRVLLAQLHETALLGQMRQIEQDYFRQEDVTTLTEVSHKISDEVRRQPAPFLFERLGDRYHHLLIDEFQDTSQEQWHNLLPLIENGVSQGHRSLVVGDAKQAIYRFRQGYVKQFVDLPHVEPYGDGTPPDNVLEQPGRSHQEPLGTNFRSQKTIVEFNNAFFPWMLRTHYAGNDLLQKTYIGPNADMPAMQQQWKETKQGGYVEASFWEADKMPQGLLDIIERLHRKGCPYGDIAILANTNKHLCNISNHLSAKGLKVASAESALLSSSWAVRLVRHLLKQMLNPQDRQNNVLADLHTRAVRGHADAPTTPLGSPDLYNLVEELLRRYVPEGMDTSYCASLLNVVAHYCATHTPVLADFVDYLDQNWDTLATNTPSSPDAIQLMTVHKAKGLQKPAVIYYHPRKKNQPKALWVEVDAKLSSIEVARVTLNKERPTPFDAAREAEARDTEMDDVNLQYVACTRAEEALFLLCEAPKPPNKDKAKKKEEATTADFTKQVYAFMKGAAAQEERHELDGDISATVFSMGALAPFAPTSQAATDAPRLQAVSFPTWRGRLNAAQPSERATIGAASDSQRRGQQAHAALAEVRTLRDVEATALRHALANDLGKDEAEALRHMLHKVVSHPLCARFFAEASTVVNEHPLMFEGEELRPDRIVMAADATYVVDYKTGASNPKYRDQVGKYCRAVTEMGYPNVSGYLLYIGDNIRVEQAY